MRIIPSVCVCEQKFNSLIKAHTTHNQLSANVHQIQTYKTLANTHTQHTWNKPRPRLNGEGSVAVTGASSFEAFDA